eukprot:2406361-Rhodomonas_salina.2
MKRLRIAESNELNIRSGQSVSEADFWYLISQGVCTLSRSPPFCCPLQLLRYCGVPGTLRASAEFSLSCVSTVEIAGKIFRFSSGTTSRAEESLNPVQPKKLSTIATMKASLTFGAIKQDRGNPYHGFCASVSTTENCQHGVTCKQTLLLLWLFSLTERFSGTGHGIH